MDADNEQDRQNAYGVALKMGPGSLPFTMECRISDRRYTFWRYGDDELQPAADVWVLRDDGVQFTINTARCCIQAGDGTGSQESQTGWWDKDQDALIEAALMFQTLYDKADRARRKRTAARQRRVGRDSLVYTNERQAEERWLDDGGCAVANTGVTPS